MNRTTTLINLLIAIISLPATAQPGTLDPSFGINGIARAPVAGTFGSGQAIAQQTDGKLLVCGSTPNYTLLARFNTDGSLDNTFGTAGLVLSDPGTSNDYIGSIAVQPDGKIVVAGNKYSAEADLIVMRYLSNGILDNSFSGDGIAQLSLTGFDDATGLVLQPDGKIVVCGEHYVGGKWKMLLARFNTDGNPDTGFGTGGVVEDEFSATSSDSPRDIALQADGRILIAGWSIDASDERMAIARYDTDGTPDGGFGTNGKLALGPGGIGSDRANSIRVQPDGGIVVAGVSNDGVFDNIVAVRLLADGTYDPTFGGGGVQAIAFPANDYTLPSLALQPDGKLLIGADNTALSTPDVKVIRLLANGTLDNTFGTGGIGTSTASAVDSEYALRTLFLSDGGIAVAGYADNSTGTDLAVWRFFSGVNIGVEENTGTRTLELFPNPATDRLLIRANASSINGNIRVQDMTGQNLRVHCTWENDRAVIDITILAAGSYTITLSTDAGLITQRFIKQ